VKFRVFLGCDAVWCPTTELTLRRNPEELE